MVPSQAREAAPVVSGRADPTIIADVFGPISESLLAAFNPYVELLAARDLRDKVARLWVLKPGHLTGETGKLRPMLAQDVLIRGLIGRRWTRSMIQAYLDREISDAAWAALLEPEQELAA